MSLHTRCKFSPRQIYRDYMTRWRVLWRGVASRRDEPTLIHIQKVLQQAVFAADITDLARTVEGKCPGASEAIDWLDMGTG